MESKEFSGAFDISDLNLRIVEAEEGFVTAWHDMKNSLIDVVTVDLNGVSGLPCFDPWIMPVGPNVHLCFSQFSADLAFIGQGIVFIAGLTALSIVFRG